MKNKAFEFRIYPNKEQKIMLAKTFGCSRLVYNHFLALKKERYEEHRETVSYNRCSKELTQLKKERSFLKEVDSVALQQSLRHLDTAFDRFFKSDCEFPKFKCKHKGKKTYSSICINNNIRLENGQPALNKKPPLQ
jgi:putative transposase